MQRRGMIVFLALNVVVSIAVAFGIISLLGGGTDDPTERLVTFEVIITATIDPLVTPYVTVITATPDPNQQLPAQQTIPDSVREGTIVPGITIVGTSVAGAATTQGTPSGEEQALGTDGVVLPENCITHVIQEGEFPSLLAETYEVSMFDIMAVNGLDDETAANLQIGEELIIPLPGCPIEVFVTAVPTATDTPDAPTEGADAGATAETTEDPSVSTTPTVTLSPTVTETPTITPTPTETPIPTITLAPTASSAQVEIVEIIGRGDITTEGVVIRNNGNTVDISGWTLSDADGNVYVFPDGRRLFSGASVTVYTRAGENTAILFFWGRDAAVFGESGAGGEAVVLANREGIAQASVRLPDAGQ